PLAILGNRHSSRPIVRSSGAEPEDRLDRHHAIDVRNRWKRTENESLHPREDGSARPDAEAEAENDSDGEGKRAPVLAKGETCVTTDGREPFAGVRPPPSELCRRIQDGHATIDIREAVARAVCRFDW